MPVEIRELQIVTVVKDAGAQAATPAAGGKNGQSADDKIVAACVEQVLEILKQKTER